MISRIRTVFCGMDLPTFYVIARSDYLKLEAVSYLPELRHFHSLNPVDHLFKYVYRCLCTHKPNHLLFLFLQVSHYFGSKITRTFFHYLKIILQNNLTILDFSNIDNTEQFILRNQMDLMIVNNWWLLPQKILDAPRFGVLNIHPSKLPQYRGSVPILWSLKNNDTETAVTFMLLNHRMDGGDILSQHLLDITPDDDSITLENKCNQIIARYLESDIKKYLSGDLKPKKQDHNLASKTAKYFDYQCISWKTEPGNAIVNKIKLYPYAWPFDKCYTYFNGKPIYFKHANTAEKLPDKLVDATPGTGIIRGIFLYIQAHNHVVISKLFIDLSLRQSLYLLQFRKQMLQFDEAKS